LIPPSTWVIQRLERFLAHRVNGMKYRARYFNAKDGSVIVSNVEAPDVESLRRATSLQGFELLSATPKITLWEIVAGNSSQKVDIADWCAQLARLLRAGMTLPEALEVQALRLSKRSDQGLAALYMELRVRLMEGKKLSDAMRLAQSFPPLLLAAVQASERSGQVANALEEYAKHEGAMRDLRRKIINAAIYPLVVIAFGFLVSLFLLGYVVPRFSKVFTDSSAKLSHSTEVIISIGNAINTHPFIVFGAIFSSIVACLYIARDPATRSVGVHFLMQFRPIRRWVGELQLTQICQSMHMLLSNGFTVLDAMKLATPLALRVDLQLAMTSATGMIETGLSTSTAWEKSGLAEAYAIRIIRSGERTGDLASCFDSLAHSYKTQVRTKLERASRLAEPLLLVIVASLIGTIVVLMYLPIVDLATSVG
jgi:general secretion pathway protein F